MAGKPNSKEARTNRANRAAQLLGRLVPYGVVLDELMKGKPGPHGWPPCSKATAKRAVAEVRAEWANGTDQQERADARGEGLQLCNDQIRKLQITNPTVPGYVPMGESRRSRELREWLRMRLDLLGVRHRKVEVEQTGQAIEVTMALPAWGSTAPDDAAEE